MSAARRTGSLCAVLRATENTSYTVAHKCARAQFLSIYDSYPHASQCQRADWKIHKLTCKKRSEVVRTQLGANIAAVLKRLCSEKAAPLEALLRSIVIHLLDLSAHPERADSHFVTFLFDFTPVSKNSKYGPSALLDIPYGERVRPHLLTACTTPRGEYLDRLASGGSQASDWNVGHEALRQDVQDNWKKTYPNEPPLRIATIIYQAIVPGCEGIMDSIRFVKMDAQEIERETLITNVKKFLCGLGGFTQSQPNEEDSDPLDSLATSAWTNQCVGHVNDFIAEDVENKWKLRVDVPTKEATSAPARKGP
ncbi:hypothetical protein PENSPDRAFT_64294 [Peniophora sp. CONT]|nr:hypothetical protein PENSPDRAFT_64294 [Peniophora sp. CONT]